MALDYQRSVEGLACYIATCDEERAPRWCPRRVRIEEEEINIENFGNTEPAEPIKEPLTAARWAFLKDLGDISRARNQMFIPFFGAFLAFIVAKSDYIIASNFVIWTELSTTFCLGVFYAWVTTKHIVVLETLRFVLTSNTKTQGFVLSQLGGKELEFVKDGAGMIQSNMNMEQITFSGQ